MTEPLVAQPSGPAPAVRAMAARARLLVNGPTTVAVVLFLLGLVLGQAILLSGAVALTYAIAATGLGLALGLAGEFLLGQLAIFAVGAYVTAVLLSPAHQWSFWPAAGIGILAAAAVGLLLSVVGLRISRFYFALVGFFLVYLIPNIVQTLSSQTGGSVGLALSTVPSLFGTRFGNREFFWLGAVFLVLALMLVRNVRAAPLGTYMRRMRENPVTVQAAGIPIWRIRLSTYVLSSVLAGVGGAIYCDLYGYILPNYFDLTTTILLFAAVLVGGPTTLLGPSIGVILLYVVPHTIINVPSDSDLIYGAIILISVIAFRGGVEPALKAQAVLLRRMLQGQRGSRPQEPPAGEPGAATVSTGSRSAGPGAAGTAADFDTGVAEILWSLREGRTGAERLVVRGAVKRFGGNAALQFEADDEITVVGGEVHLLLGPNGSGKTTLLNVAGGFIRLDGGSVCIDGADVTKRSPATIARMGVSRSFQSPSLPQEVTPCDLLAAALAQLRGISYWHWLSGDPIAARVRRTSRHLAEDVAVAAGLGDAVHQSCAGLTSGQSRIVDVLLALTSRSRIILLDEPAAGLSEVERKRLGATIRALTEHGLGVLVVEHDIELALSIADRVTVLGQGAVLAHGAPDHIKEHAAVREVLMGAAP